MPKAAFVFLASLTSKQSAKQTESTEGAGLRVNPEEKEEQTVCEADREHRRCVFASKSEGERRANGLRSRQEAPEVRVCE